MRRGGEAVVVVSAADWARLSRRRSPLIEMLRRAPRTPGGLDVSLSRDTGREVEQ
jgi:PHD/YefM family antitoxin component YafN of YafNO toxin-antitoxin module